MILSQNNFKPFVKALMSHKRVYAVVVANDEGFPLTFKTKVDDFTSEDAEHVAALFSSLAGRAKTATSSLSQGNMKSIIIESSKGEIVIAAELEYIVIALRNKAEQ